MPEPTPVPLWMTATARLIQVAMFLIPAVLIAWFLWSSHVQANDPHVQQCRSASDHRDSLKHLRWSDNRLEQAVYDRASAHAYQLCR